MSESLVALDFPPGLYNTGTVLQSKDRWFAANLVRFFQGTKQPIGGWTERTLTGDTITGTPNAAIAWRSNLGSDYLAIGTSTGLFVITGTDGVVPVLDVTPIEIQGDGYTHTWSLDVFGGFLVAVDSCDAYTGASGGGGGGGGGGGAVPGSVVNTYAWAGDSDVLSYAARLTTDAPICAFGVVVTPERFLVLLRGTEPATPSAPDFSQRRVVWPTQETLDDWIPDDTNSAGSFVLSTDGILMCGKAGRGQTYLFTTSDFWTMTYVGGTLYYSFERVGLNCGIIGANAAVTLDTGAVWMGIGRFYKFDGYVRPLDCEVADYVFSDFNDELAPDLVWTHVNARFGEIWWFYPGADSTVANRYVVYNYQENHWNFGSLSRACGVTRQPGAFPPVPVLIDADATVFDHETGDDRDGNPVFLESGPMQEGNGDRVIRVQTIIPDDKTLGDVQVQFYTSFFPDEPEVLRGPYTLKKKTSVRFTCRQIRLRIEEVLPTSWRVGTIRLGVNAAGQR